MLNDPEGMGVGSTANQAFRPCIYIYLCFHSVLPVILPVALGVSWGLDTRGVEIKLYFVTPGLRATFRLPPPHLPGEKWPSIHALSYRLERVYIMDYPINLGQEVFSTPVSDLTLSLQASASVLLPPGSPVLRDSEHLKQLLCCGEIWVSQAPELKFNIRIAFLADLHPSFSHFVSQLGDSTCRAKVCLDENHPHTGPSLIKLAKIRFGQI